MFLPTQSEKEEESLCHFIHEHLLMYGLEDQKLLFDPPLYVWRESLDQTYIYVSF